MIKMRIFLALLLIFLSLPAGVVMKVERVEGDIIDTLTFYLGKSNVKIDVVRNNRLGSYIMTDSAVLFISYTHQSYVKFDISELDRATGVIEKVLERLGPKVRVRKIRNERKGGYDCQVYEASKDGKRFAKVWVAEPKSLGLGEESFKNLDQLERYIDRNTRQVSQMRRDPFVSSEEIGGFPVAVERYDESGKVKVREELLSVEKVKIEPEIYKEPEGYERVEAKLDFERQK